MGMLVKGVWQEKMLETEDGEFVREDSLFRNWITQDGASAPSGLDGFKAESGRYHLFVSLACPWAHRTLIFRKLKKLETHINITVVDALMLDRGWTFSDISKNNPLGELDYFYQVYTYAKRDYTGRVSVPVLWDKQQNTIVSNESAEIIRMFNSAFNELTGNYDDYYPVELRADIDQFNEEIYENINNGVYRAGFASTQEAYKNAYDSIFNTLKKLENHLSTNRYLLGNRITEADWRLFTTLIRFDSVYVGHFKVNKQRIEDHPNLSNYLRDLYQIDGIAETVDLEHIKKHYYLSHSMINPSGIIPEGPEIDYTTKHNRQIMSL